MATIRALKYNGGVAKNNLDTENLQALEKGIVNLEKHIENLQKYGVPVVVTLNAFVSDTPTEINFVKNSVVIEIVTLRFLKYGKKVEKEELTLQTPYYIH